MTSARNNDRSPPAPPSAPTIPILLYHSVPRDRADASDRFAVTYERFLTHLDAIAASGRTPLTIGQVAEGLRAERQLPERCVAITFDDGFQNNIAAIELLGRRGMRATIYLTTGQLGSTTMISHAELQQMSERSDVQIGAHTVTHPRLDECSASQLQREVISSKHQLEHVLDCPIDTFAYPHGAYDTRARSAVVAAGFTSAVAVKNAISHGADDPWAIARWTVRDSTTAEQIARVLEGDGASSAWPGQRLRTRGYRVARRLKRTAQGAGPWR
jgi:peptidoglycan/xylan/chitin deacetylase (PgdA/CDA1 family)